MKKKWIWGSGLFLLLGCAHVEAPPGGPEDKTPPLIAAHYPPPSAVNQSRELKVVLQFSEWVHKDLERNKIFISPALSQKLRFDFDKSQVKITSGSKLNDNTTYTLTVMGSVKDLRNNFIGSSFQLQFSTGPTLDTGRVSGKLHTTTKEGLYLGLYPLENREVLTHLTEPGNRIPTEQPHPATERPMYLAAVDSTGYFELSGVKTGRYGVLGFHDINGNLRAEVTAEAVAIGPGEFQVKGGEPLELRLSDFDTTGMTVEGVLWTGENHRNYKGEITVDGNIRLKGKKMLEAYPKLTPAQFLVVHADSTDSIKVESVSLQPNTSEVELWVRGLKPKGLYKVLYTQEASKGLTSYFPLGQLDPGVSRDTTNIFYLPQNPRSGDSGVVLQTPMIFYCSKYITSSILDSIRGQFQIKVADSAISFSVERVNHHHFSLAFTPKGYSGQPVSISFSPPVSKVDSTDSTAVVLKTLAVMTLADSATWGKIQVDRAKPNSNWVYSLTPVSKKYKKIIHISNASRFVLDSLPPTSYLLEYYQDANGNGQWDKGGFNPWTEQEMFIEKADTVKVEAGKTTYIKG